MNTVILITGIINTICFDELIQSTSNIEAIKVASIWENEDNSYIQKLIDNNFIVLINDICKESLFTPQFITIVTGLDFIKKNYLNIDFVIKTRFDILCSDYNKYLKETKILYINKITVIGGIQVGDETFFTDTIVVGKINDMCAFYKLQEHNDTRYCEKFLIENYSNNINLGKDEIRKFLNFSFNICIQHNLEFIWIRPTWTNFITAPRLEIINDYFKQSFIWL